MTRAPQKGFAVLEAIVIVFILAAIGGAGYYVWHSKSSTGGNKQKIATSSQSDRHTTNNAQITCGEGFAGSVSGKGAFSICLPKGWHVDRDTSSDWFVIPGDVQPVADSNAELKISNDAGFGFDGPVVFDATVTDNLETSPKGTITTLKLASGQKVTKYFHVVTAAEACTGYIDCGSKGDKVYTYVVPLDGKKQLLVSYSVYGADQKNSVSLVDRIVESIRIR